MLSSHLDFGEGKELKAYEYESLTITASALGFTSSKLTATNFEDAIRAVVSVECNSIRYRIDGGDPSASEGHLIYAGGTIVIEGKTNLTRFKAHRVSADATIKITYQRYAV